jgi:hypothetical protein
MLGKTQLFYHKPILMYSTWSHLATSHPAFLPTHLLLCLTSLYLFPFISPCPTKFPVLPCLAASPVPGTIVVFIFIIIEEAEALQGMLHSDAKTGSPASSQALSLLGL